MAHPPGDAANGSAAASPTRAQGFALGCERFSRSDGAPARGSVYLCCTNGGAGKLGQVFRLELRKQELSLVPEPEADALLDGPDNLCVAPFGDVVISEDDPRIARASSSESPRAEAVTVSRAMRIRVGMSSRPRAWRPTVAQSS